jgi:hypothetical protein
MFFPNVSVEEWTKKAGIEPEEDRCQCGKKCSISIPFISKDWIGFVAPACKKCGNEAPGVLACGRTTEKQSEMDALFGLD